MSNWQIFKLLAKMLGAANAESETGLENLVVYANDQDCWESILSLSSQHLVTTQLYWALKENLAAWAKIDPDTQNYLKQIFDLNAERNHQLKNETIDLLRVLNEQKIIPVLLKGTGLLFSDHCPDIGYRMQLDIDLLARPEDLDIAVSTVRDMGYSYAEEIDHDLQPVHEQRQARLLKIYTHHQHVPPLVNPEKRVLVELHRHAYSQRFWNKFDVSNLFDCAEKKNEDGLTWYEMSPLNQRELLVVQGYIGSGYKRAFQLPLRLGCDLIDLNKRELFPGQDGRFVSEQLFLEQLINRLFATGNTKHHNSAKYKSTETQSDERQATRKSVAKYIQRMEKVMDSRFFSQMADRYSNLVRQAINVAHDPGLLRKLF